MCVYMVVMSRARQLVETFVGPVKKRRENPPAHSFPDPAGLFRAGRAVDRNRSDRIKAEHLFDTVRFVRSHRKPIKEKKTHRIRVSPSPLPRFIIEAVGKFRTRSRISLVSRRRPDVFV